MKLVPLVELEGVVSSASGMAAECSSSDVVFAMMSRSFSRWLSPLGARAPRSSMSDISKTVMTMC
eukprot:4054138-Pyramimonas_sp.AAC.1